MAREYFLKGQFEQTAPGWISDKALLRKATNELSGICRFMLGDGKITTDEAEQLKSWIASRPELRRDVVVSSFLDRISRVYADGIVTPEECQELAEAIQAFVGDDRRSSTLPLNDPMPPVAFPGKAF